MGYYDEPFQNLEGKVLHSLAVSKNRQRDLRLSLGGGEDKYVATEGDCCSESWWADIIGAVSATPGVIISIEKIDMPVPDDNRTRQQYDSAYGYKIFTDLGVIDLVFRNSSNGYYGGWAYDVDKEEELYYSINVFDDNYEVSSEWETIATNDWRA